MGIKKDITKVLSRIFTPFEKAIEPLERVWPSWLSARRWYIRIGIPILSFPLVIAAYLWNYKANVYPALPSDAAAQCCAVLPQFMQSGGIAQILTSTSWFPSFLTTMPRNTTDWFYSFWETMDWMLALAMGLAIAFTFYSILKVFEIRSRAKALGEGTGIATEAGKAAAVGAVAAIWVTLATCWGPALLAIIFGINVISFSGATDALFHITIPKPFVLLFIIAIVVGGTWWINHKEQACSLLEGECAQDASPEPK